MYLIEKEGKRVFFGNDSAIYPNETFEYLKDMILDLVFLDCTYGFNSRGFDNSHMDFSENLKGRERFYTNGTADNHTVFVGTHFAHVCNSTHEELCEGMEKHEFLTSYDGMIFDI